MTVRNILGASILTSLSNTINISALSSGIYIVEVELSDNSVVRKTFIKE